MSELPASARFADYLLLERLPGARRVWRAERRSPTPGDGKLVALRRGAGGPLRLAQGLWHVNLAAPLAGGLEAGEPWMATELVAGLSLERLLSAGPLGASAAAFVVAEAARGLAFLHGRLRDGAGLVHRRISPRKLLVGMTGEVKLVGLEEALYPRQTLEPEPAPWRSPEQRAGEPLDGRCDVYALGAVLRAALDGAGPNPARDELLYIAARCCAEERAARYPSAMALREALLGVLRRAPRSWEDDWGRAALAALVAERLPWATAEALPEEEPEPPEEPPGRSAGARGAPERSHRGRPEAVVTGAIDAARDDAPTETPAENRPAPAGAMEAQERVPDPHKGARRFGWSSLALPVSLAAVVGLAGLTLALPSLRGSSPEQTSAFGGDAPVLFHQATASRPIPVARPSEERAVYLGPLRLRLRGVERQGQALILSLRLTNPTRRPLPVPLQDARLDGSPLLSPGLLPDVSALAADAYLDLRLRFAPLPASAPLPTSLRLPGGAILPVAAPAPSEPR